MVAKTAPSHEVHVEHGDACPHCAARADRARRRTKLADAQILQDGAALARMLGTTDWDGQVSALADPEAWFINDLFARYGDMIRRAARHVFEGYDREDWLMDILVKLVADQPTGLIPYAEDQSYYAAPRRSKKSRYFASVARSWARGQTHLTSATRRGYLEIIDEHLAGPTRKLSVRKVARDEELLQSLLDSVPDGQRLAVMEIIVGTVHEEQRLNAAVEQPDDIRKWFGAVLLNAKRDAIRKQQRHRQILREKSVLLDWASLDGLRPNAFRSEGSWAHAEPRGESAEATFMRQETEREILGRIKRLPEKLYRVAWLRYFGFMNSEIAGLLDVHIKTVEYRLRTIRSPRIRKALGI